MTTTDPIADALAGRADVAALLGIPDFTDELIRSGGAIAYCDPCGVHSHHASIGDALNGADEHLADTWDVAAALVNQDCEDNTYVVTLVGGAAVAVHWGQLADDLDWEFPF